MWFFVKIITLLWFATNARIPFPLVHSWLIKLDFRFHDPPKMRMHEGIIHSCIRGSFTFFGHTLEFGFNHFIYLGFNRSAINGYSFSVSFSHGSNRGLWVLCNHNYANLISHECTNTSPFGTFVAHKTRFPIPWFTKNANARRKHPFVHSWLIHLFRSHPWVWLYSFHPSGIQQI